MPTDVLPAVLEPIGNTPPVRVTRFDTGSFDAFLTLRGVKTLCACSGTARTPWS